MTPSINSRLAPWLAMSAVFVHEANAQQPQIDTPNAQAAKTVSYYQDATSQELIELLNSDVFRERMEATRELKSRAHAHLKTEQEAPPWAQDMKDSIAKMTTEYVDWQAYYSNTTPEEVRAQSTTPEALFQNEHKRRMESILHTIDVETAKLQWRQSYTLPSAAGYTPGEVTSLYYYGLALNTGGMQSALGLDRAQDSHTSRYSSSPMLITVPPEGATFWEFAQLNRETMHFYIHRNNGRSYVSQLCCAPYLVGSNGALGGLGHVVNDYEHKGLETIRTAKSVRIYYLPDPTMTLDDVDVIRATFVTKDGKEHEAAIEAGQCEGKDTGANILLPPGIPLDDVQHIHTDCNITGAPTARTQLPVQAGLTEQVGDYLVRIERLERSKQAGDTRCVLTISLHASKPGAKAVESTYSDYLSFYHKEQPLPEAGEDAPAYLLPTRTLDVSKHGNDDGYTYELHLQQVPNVVHVNTVQQSLSHTTEHSITIPINQNPLPKDTTPPPPPMPKTADKPVPLRAIR